MGDVVEFPQKAGGMLDCFDRVQKIAGPNAQICHIVLEDGREMQCITGPKEQDNTGDCLRVLLRYWLDQQREGQGDALIAAANVRLALENTVGQWLAEQGGA